MSATSNGTGAQLQTRPLAAPLPNDEVLMLQLAREIAMDLHELDVILERYEINAERWAEIQSNRRFIALLQQSLSEWHSALNTPERVRLKSQAFVEESLPEFFARAHDSREPLSSKVDLLKTVAKIAEVGNPKPDGSVSSGEKFSVTINLGSDQLLKIEKTITLPAQVIDDGEDQ